MGNYPILSDADSIIMEILWEEKEVSSAYIVKEVDKTLGWTRQTVRTYLKRLMDKKLVGAKEEKKRFFMYYPIVSKEEYLSDRAGRFFNKHYDNLAHMVAGIAKTENISNKELDDLEKLIHELRAKENRDE
ncbi:MAG: BlaI/MecI/CopY family transcriptional regulator [Clostridiales bacterium]|nr:BlaI/MecI/CopY family transcriptional regulator [Clostridiales bacterium]